MTKVLTYQFDLQGKRAEVKDSDVALCFPSTSDDGSYFFTLKDGTRFRGEQVKEVIRNEVSPLIYF